MEDEQLRKIAQLLVNNVIEKAVDQIKTEKRKMDEILDQGVHDIVGLTIGRSITAIREGQSSPTDDKMKGFAVQLDEEVDDIVELTIGRSITAIREGQSSPTANKVEGSLGFNKSLVTSTPEVTIGTTGSKPRDDQIEPSVEGNDSHPHITISDPVKDDKSTELKKGHMTATHAQIGKATPKPNVLKRLLNRVLKKGKNEARTSDATTDGENGGSTNTSDGRKKKSSSKAHNKRDWIRRNLLCCFVRQTATVEPILD